MKKEKRKVTYAQALDAFSTLASLGFDKEKEEESKFTKSCTLLFGYLKNKTMVDYNKALSRILIKYASEDDKGNLIKINNQYQFTRDKEILKEDEIDVLKNRTVDIICEMIELNEHIEKKHHSYILDSLKGFIFRTDEELEKIREEEAKLKAQPEEPAQETNEEEIKN